MLQTSNNLRAPKELSHQCHWNDNFQFVKASTPYIPLSLGNTGIPVTTYLACKAWKCVCQSH